jgi:hypothetical protein
MDMLVKLLLSVLLHLVLLLIVVPLSFLLLLAVLLERLPISASGMRQRVATFFFTLR